uniref:Uncharacterized protein n=1 Tax=Kalanchoe fedtschenkoi TaxID=63787 RepID=A0A7N0V7P2_KALFE
MKFGKEFESQMVPEWQEKYMDYNFLKTLIKDILAYKQKFNPILHHHDDHPTISAAGPNGLSRRLSLYRAFSGLTSFPRHLLHHHHHDHQVTPDVEDPQPPPPPPIVFTSMPTAPHEAYETQFLMAGDHGGEYELVFFKRLDDEFNKVDKFYKSKVEEVMNEAEELNKQMDAFIAFRIKVEKPPQELFDRTAEMNRLAKEVEASTAALATSTPSSARAASMRRTQMDVIEEGGPSIHGTQSDDSGDEDGIKRKNSRSDERAGQLQVEMRSIKRNMRPAPLEILNKVSMIDHLDTPRSTIKRVLKVPKQTELKFSKENLKKVENKLKHAFVEFYHKLKLLKCYSFLNILAFSKIMKKYDKATARNASKPYIAMVEASYIGSSEDVTKLMERVEETFIKHFTNSNRSKGMNILRPKPKRERHSVSLLTGFFAGGTTALIVALILIIRARHLLEKKGTGTYMQTMFPLYSFFGFIVLHMIFYALNIYFWRKYRVNYAFIFGFKPGTELGYREVLLLAFGLSTLSIISVLSNLDMEMDPKTHDYKEITELLPLMVLLFVIAVLFCPFNILYRSSRFFFLKSLIHSIGAPLYKVTLPDFFVADQLTSQAQAFRSLEFYICYYGWGDYKLRGNSCKSNEVYKTFYYIVAAYPFFIRFLQSLRRLFEEKDSIHFYNALKYFSTVVAVCVRTAYSLNKEPAWMVAAWIISVISGIAVTYWDIVLDWGLLQRRSKNPWLRDKLLVPYKSVYFVAIVVNAVLRFAWFQTVLDFKITPTQNEALTALFAVLEIIRRGIWNFFRLENEHLYNVGRYRAFKSVPLPFNYNEDEDKEE